MRISVIAVLLVVLLVPAVSAENPIPSGVEDWDIALGWAADLKAVVYKAAVGVECSPVDPNGLKGKGPFSPKNPDNCLNALYSGAPRHFNFISNSAVYINGNHTQDSYFANSVLLVNGDVELPSYCKNSIVVATGNVTIGSFLVNSIVIAGKDATIKMGSYAQNAILVGGTVKTGTHLTDSWTNGRQKVGTKATGTVAGDASSVYGFLEGTAPQEPPAEPAEPKDEDERGAAPAPKDDTEQAIAGQHDFPDLWGKAKHLHVHSTEAHWNDLSRTVLATVAEVRKGADHWPIKGAFLVTGKLPSGNVTGSVQELEDSRYVGGDGEGPTHDVEDSVVVISGNYTSLKGDVDDGVIVVTGDVTIGGDVDGSVIIAGGLVTVKGSIDDSVLISLQKGFVLHKAEDSILVGNVIDADTLEECVIAGKTSDQVGKLEKCVRQDLDSIAFSKLN
jgi:hypothetical protein